MFAIIASVLLIVLCTTIQLILFSSVLCRATLRVRSCNVLFIPSLALNITFVHIERIKRRWWSGIRPHF